MISSKLKTIFIISIPVFIAHGLEEIFNGFYNVDWFFKFAFGFLETMSVPQATFIVFQIMIWLAFIVFAFLLLFNLCFFTLFQIDVNKGVFLL